jgi:flagellar basal body rod protein FlgC
MYDVFIDLAKSPQRPLTFDIRRIETKTAPTTTSQSSADAYTRKQAMIAAAEAREKAAKARGKPVRKVANTKTAPPVDLNADIPDAPQSDAARLAVEAAKRGESHLAAQLGYNPYETNKATAGQARNATVTSQHGAVGSGAAAPTPLPSVTPPREATTAAKDDDSAMDNVPPVGDGFQLAFEEVITTNDHDNVVSSFGILRILIANATTKGQQEGEEATKFRRVRLSNAKIQAAITNMHGAVELMMSVGFELAEEEGESYLVYPPGDKGPAWLPRALQQMQQYETTSSL